jgi:predicted phosphodiesterase
MEINVKRIKYTGDQVEIFAFGDWHIGNKCCAHEKIENYVKHISESPNCWWIGMGDYMESIVPMFEEKRFYSPRIDPRFGTSSKEFAEVKRLAETIKDKCLGLHVGNHELKRAKMSQDDENSVERLCRELDVPYLGHVAFTHLSLRGKTNTKFALNILSTHGSYGGDNEGGAVNAMKKWAQGWENVDVFLYGHTHWRHVWKITRKRPLFNPKSVGIENRDIIFALSGGFVKAYEVGELTYLEERNKEERKTGAVNIIVQPSARQLRVME